MATNNSDPPDLLKLNAAGVPKALARVERAVGTAEDALDVARSRYQTTVAAIIRDETLSDQGRDEARHRAAEHFTETREGLAHGRDADLASLRTSVGRVLLDGVPTDQRRALLACAAGMSEPAEAERWARAGLATGDPLPARAVSVIIGTRTTDRSAWQPLLADLVAADEVLGTAATVYAALDAAEAAPTGVEVLFQSHRWAGAPPEPASPEVERIVGTVTT